MVNVQKWSGLHSYMHFQSVLKNMLNNLSLDSSYFQVRNQPEISFFYLQIISAKNKLILTKSLRAPILAIFINFGSFWFILGDTTCFIFIINIPLATCKRTEIWRANSQEGLYSQVVERIDKRTSFRRSLV